MATERPKIVIYSDIETIQKLDEIAKENDRSRGKMADIIIKEFIKNKEINNPNIKNVNIGRDNNGNVKIQ